MSYVKIIRCSIYELQQEIYYEYNDNENIDMGTRLFYV